MLRRQPSLAEKLLWRKLRGRQGTFIFRRQHPIGDYVVDFACLQASLVIELDGWTHENADERDARRTLFLESRGFYVMRFNNSEVISDVNAVYDSIIVTCNVRWSGA